MDRDATVARLPEMYRVVLGLLAEDVPVEDVATLTGVSPEAVPALISVARAKLDRLLAEPG